MGFVKSAVESYAECAKVSSIHSTLISVSVNNLVLNIYRYKLLEFRWISRRKVNGIKIQPRARLLWKHLQPLTMGHVKSVLQFFWVILGADEYWPLSSVSVAPTGLSDAAWLVIELKTETSLKEPVHVQLETSPAVLKTDWTMTSFVTIFSGAALWCLGGAQVSAGSLLVSRKGLRLLCEMIFLSSGRKQKGLGYNQTFPMLPWGLTMSIQLSDPESWLLSAVVSGRDSSMPSTHHIAALTSA